MQNKIEEEVMEEESVSPAKRVRREDEDKGVIGGMTKKTPTTTPNPGIGGFRLPVPPIPPTRRIPGTPVQGISSPMTSQRQVKQSMTPQSQSQSNTFKLFTLDTEVSAGYSLLNNSSNTTTPLTPSSVSSNQAEVGLLGCGGFSKVKLAKHKLTGQQVALKIMDKSKLGEDACRVKTEVHALRSLRGHPSICTLYQVFETKDRYILVLELISGGELFDYIVSRVRLPEGEAAGIIRQLLSALSVMHCKGFAHRDLKPENVLISTGGGSGGNNVRKRNYRQSSPMSRQSPQVSSPMSSSCYCLPPLIKLIDFGLCADSKSAAFSDGTPTGTIEALETCCGSPAYAAPELLTSPSSNGGRFSYSGPLIDVWSLGVLSFALLIGRLPFDDDNLGNLYRKIKSGLKAGSLPVWLSPDAKSFLSSCLVTDPSKRSTVDDLMKHPFIVKNPLGCRGSNCRFRFLSNSTSSGNSTESHSSLQSKESILIFNIDEEAFASTLSSFPSISPKEIRRRITCNGLDFVSATYFLLKEQLETGRRMKKLSPSVTTNKTRIPIKSPPVTGVQQQVVTPKNVSPSASVSRKRRPSPAIATNERREGEQKTPLPLPNVIASKGINENNKSHAHTLTPTDAAIPSTPVGTGTPYAPRIVGCKLVTPRVVNVGRPSTPITPTRVAPSTPSSIQRPIIGLTNNQQSPSTSPSVNNRKRVSLPFNSNSRKNLHQQLLLKRLMKETTAGGETGEKKTIDATDGNGIAASPSSLDRTPLSPTKKLNLNQSNIVAERQRIANPFKSTENKEERKHPSGENLPPSIAQQVRQPVLSVFSTPSSQTKKRVSASISTPPFTPLSQKKTKKKSSHSLHLMSSLKKIFSSHSSSHSRRSSLLTSTAKKRKREELLMRQQESMEGILVKENKDKKHSPRIIHSSDSREAKNIVSMSSHWSDPVEAVNALETVLREAGIDVGRGGVNSNSGSNGSSTYPFLLSCIKRNQLNPRNDVSFLLEVCYFDSSSQKRNSNEDTRKRQLQLCIQRRRLRGNSWSYKVVCEEILKLCHQI